MVSTIFCHWYDTSEWHQNPYGTTLTDDKCCRIIYNAYTVQVEDESMRKRKGIPGHYSSVLHAHGYNAPDLRKECAILSKTMHQHLWSSCTF